MPPLRSRLASTMRTLGPIVARASSSTASMVDPSNRCRDKVDHSHRLELELRADLAIGEDGQPGHHVLGQAANRGAKLEAADEHRPNAALLRLAGSVRYAHGERLGGFRVEGKEAALLPRAQRLEQRVLKQRIDRD